MSENSNLRIHSRIHPGESIPETETAPKNRKKRVSTKPKRRYKPAQTQSSRAMPPSRNTHTERLLRNSAIACAVLLGVLTLTNVDQPWAKKAVNGIEQALTMRIDLDDTIGELTFVRELMPESALVFLNISGKEQLGLPVKGSLSHPWSELQPWLMFTCDSGTAVNAAEDGTVTAVSELSDGRKGLIVDHGNGLESVYAYMDTVNAASGDAVLRGQQLGTADGYMYFEWRVNGKSIDPSELMGV